MFSCWLCRVECLCVCVRCDFEFAPGDGGSTERQSGGFWLQENTPILALKLYRHGWPWCTVADSQSRINILTFYHQSDPTTILIPEAVCLARLFVCESTFL
ncbi:hypothetical protein PoB_001151200 [Plakobranchus ocellatus]|uniref:Secreted protein n=1 Tax=Plakobranchus ocellatus TaxID=259542 RepID=A0AAV3YPV7_9GAST|nr:hypothetical protein PoB_001151200 [Plakobranchus ocellatus]